MVVLLVLVHCINIGAVRMSYTVRAECCVLLQGRQINCMNIFRAAVMHLRCLLASLSLTREFTAAAVDDDDADF